MAKMNKVAAACAAIAVLSAAVYFRPPAPPEDKIAAYRGDLTRVNAEWSAEKPKAEAVLGDTNVVLAKAVALMANDPTKAIKY